MYSCALPNLIIPQVRFEDNNERRYKTIQLHPSAVDGTSSDLNWGYRNASLDLGMDALPTREGEMIAVLLFKPGARTLYTARATCAYNVVIPHQCPALGPQIRLLPRPLLT